MAKGHHRSAATGRYVKASTAARNPKTTVTERGANHSNGTHHRRAITGRYAIAEVLGVGAEQLTVDRGTSPERQDFSAIVNSPSFEGLVNRWARLQGISRSLASSALRSRLLATVHRGDRPNDEQMLRSLDSLIAALEQEQNPRHES